MTGLACSLLKERPDAEQPKSPTPEGVAKTCGGGQDAKWKLSNLFTQVGVGLVRWFCCRAISFSGLRRQPTHVSRAMPSPPSHFQPSLNQLTGQRHPDRHLHLAAVGE